MATAFSEYLPHFAPDRRSGEMDRRLKPLGFQVDVVPTDGPAEAEARGRREALAEAEAKFAQIRVADRADFELRLAERENAFAEETADVLAERLTAGLAEIGEAIAGHVGMALSRFLDSAVRTRALAELSEAVASLLMNSAASRIRVTGPGPLIDALRQQLADRGDSVEYVAASTPDVVVAIDDTIVETQIAAWLERMNAAVSGGADG